MIATKMLSLEQPEGEEDTDWVSSLVFLRYYFKIEIII